MQTLSELPLRLGRPLPWAGLGLILSGGLGECQVRPDEGGGEGEVHAALAANAAGHWRSGGGGAHRERQLLGGRSLNLLRKVLMEVRAELRS